VVSDQHLSRAGQREQGTETRDEKSDHAVKQNPARVVYHFSESTFTTEAFSTDLCFLITVL
jgi:hypothetical protein